MKKTNNQVSCLISPQVASTLETADEWAFYILDSARKQISKANFYKLSLYATNLPTMYGAPEEMRAEITELILQTLRNLSQY